MQNVIGLMSGTSMDGVDAAILVTDGVTIAGTGPTLFRPYDENEKALLRKALAEARTIADRTARPPALAEAEAMVTEAHAEAVERLRRDYGKPVQLIGFHGQTVFHAPERRLTVQIGDGRKLAERTGIPVVFDFRAADVAAGGQGAPFVPLYHQALVRSAGLTGDIVVANIGGVANITRIAADGGISSGDTGPGNALMDDRMRMAAGAATVPAGAAAGRGGGAAEAAPNAGGDRAPASAPAPPVAGVAAMAAAVAGPAVDYGGATAARGAVRRDRLAAMLGRDWFDLPMPKSLDRDAFDLGFVTDLSLEDAMATLAAFTAESLAKGIAIAGGADIVIVSGGGAHNPVLLRMLAEAAGAEVKRAADLGWDGDFVEAQAFAYLAARSVAGLPLSLPETTGVPYPMPGGVLAEPEGVAA